MNTKTYRVTCLKCKQTESLLIDESTHQVLDFGRKAETNVLSVRWRGDLQYGFECLCGNDNRLALSEKTDFQKLVQGDQMSVKKIADSLNIPDKKQFSLESA